MTNEGGGVYSPSHWAPCPCCGAGIEEVGAGETAHDKNLGLAKAVREINAFEAVNGVMADHLTDGGRY